MSGARLNDPIISYHSGFEPDLVFGIDKIGTEWLNARKLRLRDIGNTYIQGSSNGITWSNFINSSHTYLRISTDGGITWRNLDADLLRDGVTNKFYTEAKVSANSSVAANTAARHTHANKALLDNLVTNGTGQNFLSDDGTYKNFQVITPLILDGDIFASGSITGGTFTDGVLSISNGFINNISGIDPVGYITFKDNPAPSYQPYRLFADTNNKTLSLYTSVPGTSLQIGLENWTYVYNNTGSTIVNGKVVRINGASTGYPTIELASNDNFEHVQGLLGVTTHNIGTGEHGFVTTFGEVRDLNTSSFLNGSVLYLGTNGSIVNTRPTHPNYIIEIGICNNSDSINGKILVNTKGRVVDITKNVFNGSFIDPMVFTVTSNGTTITGSLQRIGGGDLTINYSTGLYRLDCTPPVTITIPPGTDTTPLLSYVYIPVSTKVLTIGTSWPNTEHVKVSTVVAQSAATTQTRGILRNQNWNDNLADSTGEGQLSFINERLRLINAEWYSGVNPLLTIVPITAAPDNVYFSATSGKVYQLHLQDFPAISMPTNGVFVVNHNTTPYTYTTNLNTLLTTATGSSLSGKSFSFVIWGIQNEVGEQSHLMVNLPTGSYNTSADAILDVQGYSVYTIPTLYRGVGFLIARVTMSHSTSNGGTWTLNQTQDLRGYLPNNTAGGGAVGGGVGVSSLLQLSDVFASTYVGQAGKVLKVNLGETGVFFEAELDPVFKAHTTYNISNGTGFLKNNGSGVWSYDNSTYLKTNEPLFANRYFYLRNYSDNNSEHPIIEVGNSRGTETSPAYLQNGDEIGAVAFRGAGVGFAGGSGMNSLATENWNITSLGSKLTFFTTPNLSTTKATRFVIEQNGRGYFGGNFGIGSFDKAAYPLTVAADGTGIAHVNSSGNLRIYTQLAGDAARMYFSNASGTLSLLNTNGNSYWMGGRFGFGNNNPAYTVDISGQLYASDNIYSKGNIYVGFGKTIPNNNTSLSINSFDAAPLLYFQRGGVNKSAIYHNQTNDALYIRNLSAGDVRIYSGANLFVDSGSISANQLKSTIATGTAPITVSSTTLVNNLNADLLDGYHASSFIQNHSVTNNYLLKSNGLGGISQSVIFDNGTNVGIGTTGPTSNLHILNSSAQATLKVESTGAVAGSRAEIIFASQLGDVSLRFNTESSNSINYIQSSNYARTGNRPLYLTGYLGNQGSTAKFDFATSLFTGNVGIETTEPGVKLDVVGTHVSGVGLARFKGNSAYGFVTLDTTTGGASDDGGFLINLGGTIKGQFGARGDNAVYIKNRVYGPNDIMTFTSNGNVGISLTNPSEKLDVNGNIKSSSLSGVGTRLVTANSSGVLGSIDYNYINLNSFSSGTATSGQVPTANGSGGITWANQSGSGGYWSQSSGAIYPTTITDEVRIGSTTDLGSQKLQVDANSVFRLRNVNTTQSIDFITAVTGTQPYFRLEHDGNNGLRIAGHIGSGEYRSMIEMKYPSLVSYFSTAIKLGTTSLEEAGVMRYNGTNFQGYNGTTWVNLDGSGTSQWTNDTYGINYLSNIGVGTTSTSGIKLSAYQNGTGYVASLVNQSSSGSGLWLSGGGDATYSLEVNNYAGTRRFGILGSGKIFSYGLTNSTSSNVLYYNSSTGEISYGAATGGTSQWVNDTYGINYTSGNVSVGAASSSSVKFKSSLNTADAYAGSFENSNASGNGLYIRGGYTNRYALAVDDYNTADLFSIMGDGKIYANKLTNSSTSYTLYYNTSTKEISYALAPSGGGGDYWSKSSGVIFPTTTTDKLVIGKTTSSGEAMFEVQGKSAFSDEISVGTRLWMGGGSVVLNNAPGQLLLSTNMSTENDIALSVRSSVYNPSGSLFRVRGNGYIDIAFNDNSPTVYTASSGVLRAGSNGKLYWKTISGGEYDLTATGSGGGTPGGSINSIQYNNSGAFGGFGNVGTYTISLGKPLELENRLNHPSATGQGIVTYDYIEDRVYVGTYGAQMPINRQKTQTPTIATNMTLDWRNGANMSITLTTNVALSIQNIPDGESGTILVKQDATGNRNISFTVWADSGLNSLTQTKIGSITDINKVSNKYSTITYKRFAGVVTLVYGEEN